MYLKRLELSGFKTFADNTTLEFGSGVSGIVGPNGSGKSNLADAILWALGEQSMKSLRSAKAQDVIFAGSESRRRAGVGEVSITLDNSDGTLPLDFSEITVTRRVFRTGEGEYYINRVPCRLRDIHELLLDTGIGKHAYSMISQTEIDRILSVRSEDRREIFEQAAGIQRYRQRKNEAGRKLDRVCANLVRVNDILHELEAQVEPLSQQSETARQYKEFSKELFDLKLSLMVHQRAALAENLERARERQVEIEREIEGARTRSHQLAAEEVELRARLQELETRLEETRALVSQLSSQVDRADGRLALTKQRIEDLKAQKAQAEQELAQLAERKRAAEEELAESERQRPALASEAEQLRAQIEAREEQLRQETGTLQLTGQSAEEQRTGHLDALRELADARNRLGQCESLLEAARARLARLKEQREARRAQQQELAAQVQSAERNVAEVRKEGEHRAGELSGLRLERQAAEAAASELAAEELKLREELSAARSRQRALEEMERAREGLRAGTRAVLDAVESGRLTGEYLTVAELVQVPKELEAAVEAALGPAAGDLVVPTEREAQQAISYLKESQRGRATFLPRSWVRIGSRPEGVAALAAKPGCLGVAADLIGCKDGGEDLVEMLLGRVLVAENIDAAMQLSRQASGWRSVVTLDGDIIRPWGSVTGGSRTSRVGLLGRAREIAELGERVQELERALEQASGNLEQAQQRARAAGEKGETLRDELERAAARLAEAERQAEVLAEKARLESEREQALLSEEGALEEESGQIEQERIEAASRVEQLEAQRRAVETAMTEVESALAVGRDAREELSKTTSEMRVRLTAVEGDLRAQEARAESARRNLQMLDRAMEERQSLIDRTESGRLEIDAGLGDLGTEQERLKQAHARAEEELAQSQEKRRELLDALATNRESAAQNRAETEAAQNRGHRIELRITQIQSEIGFCERTLAEEYRISLEEAQQRAGEIQSRTSAQARLKELEAAIGALGEVNLGAVEEYDRVKQRLEFLGGQKADLEGAREDLQQAITEIDREATSRFLAALERIRREFQQLFVRLFGGGNAELRLTDDENVLDCGIDVTVTVPGKKTRDLLQLSGGERALTAAAILFSLLKVKPSPFVILDEVDAPLDDSNVGRYCDVLRDFAQQSQFIVITHNKGTMEATDVLYGVTLEEAGVSKLIGVRLRDEEPAPAADQALVEADEAPAEPAAQEGGEAAEQAA